MLLNKFRQGIQALGLPKFFSYLSIFLFVLIALYAYITLESAKKSLDYVLTPPNLPSLPELDDKNPRQHLNQNWSVDQAEWFHHVSQGTGTIPIPYHWFVNLEKPKNRPWQIFGGDKGLFIDNKYILRLGFVKGHKSAINPDGLPYGFAKTESLYFSGLEYEATAVGFTCAACHTGRLINNKTEYIIEGGPATIDLGLFTKTLGSALGQTALSSKLPIFRGRFNRFADRVLGENSNPQTIAALKKQLIATVAVLAKTTDTIEVTEGFTRLDALNRIGNQVFSYNLDRHQNYSAINAPVNFPHLWTAPWFNWVQYDGSIMQPLIRNAGEALGVDANVNTIAPLHGQRFASSLPIKTLYNIEELLAGKNPSTSHEFDGLLSPPWPDSFPKIIEAKRKAGEDLYNDHCKGCHLPALNSSAFWDGGYFKQIAYTKNGASENTEEKYMHLNIIPLSEIGTDPSQASILAFRTVDSTGLGLDTEVCTNAQVKPGSPWVYNKQQNGNDGELTFIPLKDSPVGNFGLALGAFVQETNDQWMQQNHIPAEWRPIYVSGRPNCLQVNKGYKARPLNGIWATAPFLHNGSIPTLFDILSPLAERPVLVQLGNLEFDVDNVGIVQPSELNKESENCEKNGRKLATKYDDDGLFVLDTCVRGNFNTGHQFEKGYVRGQTNPQGVIGPYFSEQERYELVEYLKTI